ncbi:MAG: sensor histidine kinase [Acutalibacter sp.]|jgi:signal transduction histidine kinase
MKKKRIRSITAITLRLGALTLVLWLLGMGLLTLGTAQYVHREVVEEGSSLAQDAGKLGYLDEYYARDNGENLQQLKKTPGFLDHAMLESLEHGSVTVDVPHLYQKNGSSWSIYDTSLVECKIALAFVDSQGKVLHQSGDFLSFQYFSQEAWLSGEDVLREGYAWLDLSDSTDERYQLFRTSYTSRGDLFDLTALRLTGLFDGARFEPYALDILTSEAYSKGVAEWMAQTQSSPPSETPSPNAAQNSTSAGGQSSAVATEVQTPPHTYGLLDSLGYVEWQPLFDHTDQADPGAELVTIYATQPTMMRYQQGGKVNYWEGSYPSLIDLLLSRIPDASKGTADFSSASDEESLWNMVVLSAEKYIDLTGYDPYKLEEPYPQPDFTLIAAVQASPLKIAMGFLWKIYLATGLAALAGVLLIRRSIKRHLLRPLAEINRGMAAGWAHLPDWGWDRLLWREAAQLTQQYEVTQDQLHRDKNELARLNTALDYARTAEENRRQMISHLTHQLKTPLAVIHGYAEGLREHIAEDKRDHYVEMILSEAERSDRMVLEMLDLSRLEAGRVKLSRDQVPLLALTQGALEKLERTIETKQLQVEFSTQEEVVITADEGRMAQVLENFVTNAVKYTPQGGWIRVKLERGERKVTFTLENESPPLSPEVLRQVWDPFYRAEDTRTEEGSGLGLAIVKSILDLHGGTCFARNLLQGVAFGFTLPL